MTLSTSKQFPTVALAGSILLALVMCPAAALSQPERVASTTSALLKKPAKQVFGAIKAPISMKARAIGTYARGCLAGAQALPVDGAAWQVMRTSRNRNWAHPAMISLIEKLASDAKKYDGWNGLLVGDVAQPRGGPMRDGHASHQMGLDADIWLTPMPGYTLTTEEREDMVPREMVKDRHTLDRSAWTEAQARLIKRAASYPQVARIFVNPPIKAELCKWATGDRSWLAKVRPWYGHTFHFHVRIVCPKDSPDCKNQSPAVPKDGTGCGQELAYWMGDKPWYWIEHPKLQNPHPPPPPPLSSLPAECRRIALTR
ncbi:penicillin-insensitive murein endopeptidase [Nordella sp. HKS 07]|uniref:penicillin-insensitive murein endopeptidase n=1 Tax=Nordella sp. HKS 07 TaxID=2712222 RepID=UPI00352DD59D